MSRSVTAIERDLSHAYRAWDALPKIELGCQQLDAARLETKKPINLLRIECHEAYQIRDAKEQRAA